ncbi:exopolysaccharide biosynthesis polyprenyl glycosylphosphotransferase [Maricaulis sp.]|uniref:exopolysaccharide biosynthesis polyprenyl glycosylphosphotransferase n=1 Tax=Maricaulis sp. TaxID=1486257 RepID=UPI002B277FB7|nr:exopolysaccharide biosynthesis polyprenyl glycosylphosphotransferase [Maricaulis sp.]
MDYSNLPSQSEQQSRKASGPANDMSDALRPSNPDTASLTRAHLKADARTPRNRINRKALGHIWQSIDIFVVLLLTVTGALALSGGAITSVAAGELLPLLAFAALCPALTLMMGLYRIDPRESAVLRMLRAVIATALTGSAITALSWLTAPDLAHQVATFAITGVGALTLLHVIYAAFIQHWGKSGRLARNVVLVGATANASKLIKANAGSGTVNVVGIFDDRTARSPQALAGAPYLGTTDDLVGWSLLHEVDRIILTVSPKAEDRVRLLLGKLRALPHTVCLLLDFDSLGPSQTTLDDIVGVQAARMSGLEERFGHNLAKRTQDLILGVGLFVAALPVMALIAVAVRLGSPGPILFRQTREGFNGRPIKVLKFRTMRHDPASAAKPMRQVELDDPRVTRIGGFLRKTSLDELPQLWNVLTGEMSLVGPRPHAPGMRTGGTETAKLVAEYAHRHRVKPGITGWAQINGSRGPLHTPEAARERIALDVAYIAKANVWFDLWIMIRTLPALLGDKANIR